MAGSIIRHAVQRLERPTLLALVLSLVVDVVRMVLFFVASSTAGRTMNLGAAVLVWLMFGDVGIAGATLGMAALRLSVPLPMLIIAWARRYPRSALLLVAGVVAGRLPTDDEMKRAGAGGRGEARVEETTEPAASAGAGAGAGAGATDTSGTSGAYGTAGSSSSTAGARRAPGASGGGAGQRRRRRKPAYDGQACMVFDISDVPDGAVVEPQSGVLTATSPNAF